MEKSLITKHNKVTMAFVLVANKLVNFLFVSSVLLGVDEALSVGPLVIQGTALSGIMVAIVAPVFYNLISRGFRPRELTAVNVSLLVLYMTFVLFVGLGSVIQSDLIPLLILAVSLSARGVCDAIISVEGLVIQRGLVTLLFIEPVRWTIFFMGEVTGLYSIALLISMPLVGDWLVRIDRLRRISFNWYGAVSEISKSLKGDVRLRTAYKAIVISQGEQIFLFAWAKNLSSQESVLYLFSLQAVGLLILMFLPGWMELLRASVGAEKSVKTQIMHSHAALLYRIHLTVGSVLIVSLLLLGFTEMSVSAMLSLAPVGGFADRLGDIDISTALLVIFVIASLRSKFMDTNLLATSDFYYVKIIVSQVCFLIGTMLLLLDLLELSSMGTLIGVYGCAYISSAIYQRSRHFTWPRSLRYKENRD